MRIRRFVGNIMFQILPISGCFALKRSILKWMKVECGDGVRMNGHTWIYGHGGLRIGKDTWIGPGCRFYITEGTLVAIGQNCDIAPEVAFVTGSHILGTRERRAGRGVSNSISVGDGCWIGYRVSMMGGVEIGPGSMVAANALVRDGFPANTLIAGVPAESKKRFNE